MKEKNYRLRSWLTGYAMIAPFYLIFLFIYFLPVIETVWNSFTDLKLFEKAKFYWFPQLCQRF